MRAVAMQLADPNLSKDMHNILQARLSKIREHYQKTCAPARIPASKIPVPVPKAPENPEKYFLLRLRTYTWHIQNISDDDHKKWDAIVRSPNLSNTDIKDMNDAGIKIKITMDDFAGHLEIHDPFVMIHCMHGVGKCNINRVLNHIGGLTPNTRSPTKFGITTRDGRFLGYIIYAWSLPDTNITNFYDGKHLMQKI
jgi:hypothetical protein